MTAEKNSKLKSFPLAKPYSKEARAARVLELRDRVRAGTYGLDAEAVALAIIDAGAVDLVAEHSLPTSPAGFRRALAHRVVKPAPQSPSREKAVG